MYIYVSLTVCRIKCFIAMKMGKLLPVFAAVFATGCGSVSGSGSGSAYASDTAPPCASASAFTLCFMLATAAFFNKSPPEA